MEWASSNGAEFTVGSLLQLVREHVSHTILLLCKFEILPEKKLNHTQAVFYCKLHVGGRTYIGHSRRESLQVKMQTIELCTFLPKEKFWGMATRDTRFQQAPSVILTLTKTGNTWIRKAGLICKGKQSLLN